MFRRIVVPLSSGQSRRRRVDFRQCKCNNVSAFRRAASEKMLKNFFVPFLGPMYLEAEGTVRGLYISWHSRHPTKPRSPAKPLWEPLMSQPVTEVKRLRGSVSTIVCPSQIRHWLHLIEPANAQWESVKRQP